MENNKYLSLFNSLMDSLFENEDIRKFFYYKNSPFFNVPDEPGIYSVIKLDGFIWEILDKPHGPSTYKGVKIEKPDKKIEDVNDKYLYIGKAGVSLNARAKQFMKFGYAKDNVTIPHYCGSSLWYVNNNKNFFFSFATNESVKQKQFDILYKPAVEIFEQVKSKKRTDIANSLQVGLIVLHQLAYNGLTPFANSTNEKAVLEMKDFWQKYWYDYVEKH